LHTPFPYEEATAHFSGSEGVVFCFGIPAAVRDEIKLGLPFSYDVVSASKLRNLRLDCGPGNRYAALIEWSKDTANRSNELLRQLRELYPCMPRCLWCASSRRDDLPLQLLADGSVDHIIHEQSPALVCAVLCNLLVRSEALGNLKSKCDALADSSARDSLTALFNHAKILSELSKEFQRASRSRRPVSCLMIDIDHFKAVNDTYGHRFGDYILAEVARVLTLETRSTDVLGRYGGEEFLAILPDCDCHGALNLAEKIRLAIENHTFSAGGIQALVTVSIGVASTSDSAVHTAEHLLRNSDRALYFAKGTGRNRVAAAHEHTSLSEFESFHREQFGKDALSIVVALCSPDASLRERFSRIVALERVKLVTFDTPKDFFATFESSGPDIALFDTRPLSYGAEIVRQLAARVHLQHVAVGVIVTPSEGPGQAEILNEADFVLLDSENDETLAGMLRLAVYACVASRDVVRLRQELCQTQRRLARKERLATFGEITKSLLDEIMNWQTHASGAGPNAVSASLDQRLAAICQRLDAAGLTRERQPREPSQVDHLVRRAMSELEARFAGDVFTAGIVAVQLHIPQALEILVHSDDIVTALIELLANSYEAMPRGGRLRIYAEKDDLAVRLVIADTGLGIAPSDLPRIYEPHFTNHPERGALGLGIPIAQAILREHQATLQFNSTPGKGTAAIITFSSVHADEEPTMRWRLPH
jgi:diguanylate cyclase (GGDEF)-like protein